METLVPLSSLEGRPFMSEGSVWAVEGDGGDSSSATTCDLLEPACVEAGDVVLEVEVVAAERFVMVWQGTAAHAVRVRGDQNPYLFSLDTVSVLCRVAVSLSCYSCYCSGSSSSERERSSQQLTIEQRNTSRKKGSERE